ncbi:MAG: ATP-binding cassette domain-containing protein [Candidatus Methanosuratincola petrocarbonis]|nr:ATP-binding cassette domain-containing protein [Candidatus Methanosuratincola sp.]
MTGLAMMIQTFGITKRYKNTIAVNHIDLSIEEGEIFGLLGPNGAGKTTLLSMLATLIPPTEGTAKVNGYDIRSEPGKVRASIGMVFQTPSSDEILTGRENLYLHALMYGVPKEERRKRIEEVLELVDLTDRGNDLVKTYSGGMRRRLELARGLLHMPKILFLDEPTLGLDPQTRQHIWDYIRRLSKEQGVTIIITTHYMEEADSLCDRVAIIDHGEIKALDPPSMLKMKVGKSMIRARVESPNLEYIRRLPYVTKAEAKDGTVTIILSEAGAHIQEILCNLGNVSFVELREPTLNDVFLQITGKEIREESAEEWAEVYARAGST